MPTLAIDKLTLYDQLGFNPQTYTDADFDELCFEYGIELDEITSEREDAAKGTKLSKAELKKLSDAVIYKIDLPANRYDLLCIEGLVRALQVFLGEREAPTYTVLPEANHVCNVVKSHVDQIRPFVVCAMLKDVTFTQERYDSFIGLQDQLHRNLCRQRTLVAIGTHDADTLQGPFTYDARPPSAIEFVPLVPNDQSFTAGELLEHYNTDVGCKHLKPYVPIIQDSPVYPVVLDAKETVLSLPPIINGDHSKITLDTTNVFIECTATDLTKANIVLDTVVAMFSEYCAQPFSVEPVTVNYLEGDTIVSSYVTPQMFTRRETAKVEFVNSINGINLSASDMVTLCNKVQLGPAQLLDNDTVLQVTVPPTRSDILHAVDIAEDVGIAFGYNNIVKKVPTTSTVGKEQPIAILGDLLRDEIGRAGYTEVLTFGLCSIADNFTNLRRAVTDAVHISNPANVEYQVVRTVLLPGLLKTLQHNKSASFANGFKLFEVSDVVIPDDTYEVTNTIVGSKNVRHVCAVYAGPTSGFEIIHGLVDRILTLTEVAPSPEYISNSATKTAKTKDRVTKDGWFYSIEELKEGGHSDAPTYFPGRAAEIWLTKPGEERKSIGTFGILHPEVLGNFDIQYPSSSLELNLEELL